MSAAGKTQLGDVSETHAFDEQRLFEYLKQHIDGFGEDMVVRQFAGGASNPTFQLITQTADGERKYVLRKKPPGKLLPSAHQVDREYRVMKALEATDVAVPKMRHLCEDDTIIGTSFFVMDFLEGRIFRDARLPDLQPAERRAVYDAMNDMLTRLHKVDYKAVGLESFGRPGNYYERQIKRWTKQYRDAETEHIPEMESLIERLPARIPQDNTVTIAHGDYRLENMIYHPEEPRVLAILDWELSTLGHPLADLGYNCFLWHSKSESWGTLDGIDLKESGIPSEAEYVDAYLKRMGQGKVDDWNFYLSFAVFRLASISQGVFRRAQMGIVPRETELINGAPDLSKTALMLLDRN